MRSFASASGGATGVDRAAPQRLEPPGHKTGDRRIMFDFDRVIDRRGTHSVKWDGMAGRFGLTDPDIIPMWVADMDFECPPAVNDAIRALADHGVHVAQHDLRPQHPGAGAQQLGDQELLEALQQPVLDQLAPHRHARPTCWLRRRN